MTPKRRSISLALTALTALTAVMSAGTVLAYPKPAGVPTRWELEFKPGPLRLYIDEADQQGYWYFTYLVANRTGRDQVWAPSLTLFTDAGEILASGRRVPSRVVEALRDLLGNRLLESQNEIIGELFYGKEHAKEGLAVWPAADLDVNEISMFVAGISGESVTVPNPVTGEPVLLRKTVQRDYLVRGIAVSRGSEPVELIRQRWVMR